jgi:hypothetical protein
MRPPPFWGIVQHLLADIAAEPVCPISKSQVVQVWMADAAYNIVLLNIISRAQYGILFYFRETFIVYLGEVFGYNLFCLIQG